MLGSQTFKTMENSGNQDFSSYNYSQEIQNTLARAEMINNMNMNIGPGDSTQNAYARAEMNNNVDMNLGPGGLGSGPQFSVQSVDLEKQKSLEKTCESLQTQVPYEACRKKNCLQGVRPGLTQTRLYSHRRWLEA